MEHLAEIRQIRQQHTGASRRKLPLPLAEGLRVAQVSARGLLFADSHYFAIASAATLQAFGPQVLVGSAAELEILANQVAENALQFNSVDRALFVITDCRDVPLREASRLLLWRSFGVPVYELLLSGDGSPIASECDAHDGWHIEGQVKFSLVNGELWFQNKRSPAQGTGLTGEIDESLCPCGQPGKRILNAAMDYRDPVRHHLARTA